MNTQIPLDRKPAVASCEPVRSRETPAIRTFTSEELFRGTTEIAIEHAGSFYRLKITRQGKLILNK